VRDCATRPNQVPPGIMSAHDSFWLSQAQAERSALRTTHSGRGTAEAFGASAVSPHTGSSSIDADDLTCHDITIDVSRSHRWHRAL
jgi:hypothetical protein